MFTDPAIHTMRKHPFEITETSNLQLNGINGFNFGMHPECNSICQQLGIAKGKKLMENEVFSYNSDENCTKSENVMICDLCLGFDRVTPKEYQTRLDNYSTDENISKDVLKREIKQIEVLL